MTAFALLLALSAAAVPQDRVSLVTGEVLSGDVREARLQEVILVSADGSESRLDSNRILELQFGNPPDLLARGRRFLERLDYQNAVGTLGEAASAGGEDWVKEVAELERAEALLAWSDIDPGRAGESETAFRNWLAAYPDSWFQVRGRIGRARALARSGKTEEAARLLEELSSLAFEKNLGRQVELQAKLERSLVYLEGDQSQVAEARLRDLVPSIQETLASADTEAGLRPRLTGLLSRAQIALGDAIEAKEGSTSARAYWEGLLRDRRATVDVRAAALTGLARQSMGAGRKREAQLLLAQAVGTLQASPEVAARALFQLGEVTEALNNDVADSRAYYQRIVDTYPRTSWAVKAREKLP